MVKSLGGDPLTLSQPGGGDFDWNNIDGSVFSALKDPSSDAEGKALVVLNSLYASKDAMQGIAQTNAASEWMDAIITAMKRLVSV